MDVGAVILAAMTENESVWARRVEEFHRSGLTGPGFVQGRGYTVAALKYWEKKLKAAPPPRPLSLARVVRPGMVVEPTADAAIEVVIGSARIVVRRGFDPELVRALVAALGGAQ